MGLSWRCAFLHSRCFRVFILTSLLVFSVLYIVLTIGVIFTPATLLIKKWYDPLPKAIVSVKDSAQIIYPMIEDVSKLSNTVIRADYFFQFGFSEFNKTYNIIDQTIDEQVFPILNLTNSAISGATGFVNKIADFLHSIHINFNISFVDNLNIINDILSEVPQQLTDLQFQMDKATRAGEALGQSIDVVGHRFIKFYHTCDNLTDVVDNVFQDVDIIVQQMDVLEDSIPVVVVLGKAVACFVMVWLAFVTMIIFLYVKYHKPVG
ncbi:hypothetical protein EIN_406220 [Entamoeba invadens IP1]|uniref:Uncharacterized protein n=1 Tax=Entamoeba invadens IP1 TaxID=370355 RepID=A0A0A1U6W9_ENTIV|nr:hypothetical protein EIN_406220 [Entamoeba invadens IP1]ELP90158.1 hypothetical protein EIN_406220 [Entamoeba invadens IP1]|eukprot:XP_004256929.1 hypothetical protein EIN_406220 [Entamoeba invadens IP1]